MMPFSLFQNEAEPNSLFSWTLQKLIAEINDLSPIERKFSRERFYLVIYRRKQMTPVSLNIPVLSF